MLALAIHLPLFPGLPCPRQLLGRRHNPVATLGILSDRKLCAHLAGSTASTTGPASSPARPAATAPRPADGRHRRAIRPVRGPRYGAVARGGPGRRGGSDCPESAGGGGAGLSDHSELLSSAARCGRVVLQDDAKGMRCEGVAWVANVCEGMRTTGGGAVTKKSDNGSRWTGSYRQPRRSTSCRRALIAPGPALQHPPTMTPAQVSS